MATKIDAYELKKMLDDDIEWVEKNASTIGEKEAEGMVFGFRQAKLDVENLLYLENVRV